MNTLPPLRAIQIFEVIGHSHNLADAARRLQITPGAITQQLKLLEQALNATLTFRDGRQIRLTPAGLRFHEACSSAFERLREAQAELERSTNDANLSISALPSLLKGWLAPLVFEWQDAFHPELSIQFKGSHSEPSTELDDVDFRISYGNTAETSDAALALFTDSVVPACSPALLASGPPLREPADMLRYPLLGTDWQPKFTSPPSWQEWFAANRVHYDEKMIRSHRVFSLSHMALESAVAGQGFTLGQCAMIGAHVAAGTLVIPFRHALPLPWPYILKWKPSVFHRPHCRDFHRWLLARGKQQDALNRQMLA